MKVFAKKNNNWSKSGFAVKIKYLKSFQLREYRHKLTSEKEKLKS